MANSGIMPVQPATGDGFMPRILVVDDEPTNVELLKLALGRKRFEVLGAYTGLDGLTLAQVEMPDAIILDLMLPDITGEDFCLQLRQNPSIGHLPILVLTARGNTSASIDAVLAAGANAYMSKPANFAALADQLEQLIAAGDSLQNLHSSAMNR
jgi:two-component system, cell cycle response regulator